MPRSPHPLALVLSLALVLPLAARAQDTTQKGVRIGLTYDPGTRPGVLVLPVAGTAGDSIGAIVRRDLDFGDRVAVLDAGIAGAPMAGQGLDYPLVAKLGAAAVLQMTVTAAGLHVALHDVAQRRVVQVRDFPLAAAPLGAGWRLAVHG